MVFDRAECVGLVKEHKADCLFLWYKYHFCSDGLICKLLLNSNEFLAHVRYEYVSLSKFYIYSAKKLIWFSAIIQRVRSGKCLLGSNHPRQSDEVAHR